MNSTKSTLHRRVSTFVDWVKTDDSREEKIKSQADAIRRRISGQARKDGLTIRSTPQAGSFAKKTGLRRHMQGGVPIEGQDVDLPFVCSPTTKEDEELDNLLDRFEDYAEKSYPETNRRRTNSSIELSFTGSKVNYDLVPMLATKDPQRQIIIRSNGERTETSVQQHVEFVKRRTKASNELWGRVKFNECVRLLKWWREFREDQSGLHIPNIVIELLAADAYDRYQVEKSYPATLARWFGYLAHVVDRRRQVAFADYFPIPRPCDEHRWEVIDPVSPENVITKAWTNLDIDRFAGWFAEGRDALMRAIRCDGDDDDHGALRHMVELFGTPFKHHCDEE